MAYKVIILYRLYMPSYFLGTFTEYPQISDDDYGHHLYRLHAVTDDYNLSGFPQVVRCLRQATAGDGREEGKKGA